MEIPNQDFPCKIESIYGYVRVFVVVGHRRFLIITTTILLISAFISVDAGLEWRGREGLGVRGREVGTKSSSTTPPSED
jgi:hypothetical protein